MADQLEPARDRGPVSSRSSRRAVSSGDLALGAAPLGDLPGIAVERVAVLADEPDAPVVVDGQDADGPVLEVDDAVDPRLAVGPDDLVLADGDPGVLVDRPAARGSSRGWRSARAIGHAAASPAQPLSAAWRVAPMSAGLLATRMPAPSRAAILSDALPEPPEMIAPAWPIRLPGRGGLAGDERGQRLGELARRLQRGGLLLGVAADLAHHQHGVGVGVGLEQRSGRRRSSSR